MIFEFLYTRVAVCCMSHPLSLSKQPPMRQHRGGRQGLSHTTFHPFPIHVFLLCKQPGSRLGVPRHVTKGVLMQGSRVVYGFLLFLSFILSVLLFIWGSQQYLPPPHIRPVTGLVKRLQTEPPPRIERPSAMSLPPPLRARTAPCRLPPRWI